MKRGMYVNYPAGIVIVSNLQNLLTYAAGCIILNYFSTILAVMYLIYAFALEWRVISRHCVHCWYYGKTCAFGKGKMSALFFRKGNSSDFCVRPMKWHDMIPDMLIPVIPFMAGLVLLIIDFRLVVLFWIGVLVFLTTVGNSFVRGSLACKFCKQKEIGCPADKLFHGNP